MDSDISDISVVPDRPSVADVVTGAAPLLGSAERSGLMLSPWAVRLDERNADNALAVEVAENIAEGELPWQIARRFGVKRGQLLMWLRADVERYAMYCSALQARSDELVMEGFGIVDGDDGNGVEPDRVAGAKLRVDYRRWVASKWDRARFGEDAKVSVGVGVKVVMSKDDVGML